MEKRIADGADPIVKKAANDAMAIQNAINLRAIVGTFHRHLLDLGRNGVDGDGLNNHPVTLAFLSKLNSLCRLDTTREIAGLENCARLERGQTVEYEVIPL